jgi:ubiquinone/menaquinone biosynthesis C-methylase UbiE
MTSPTTTTPDDLTVTPSPADTDRALKARHRAVWASGDYPTLARDLIWTLGPTLVEAAGISAGQQVLDVAAGSGNVAIPAAARGATVIASDLTPELFDAGRVAARDAGVDIDWRTADAEALGLPDGAFDAVLSSVGVMFAPHHQAAADELVRVCRPGGTIGLLSWTPTGFIGQLFATMKPFNPPAPQGVQPPPLWGDEAHVRALLGDRVSGVDARTGSVAITRFPERGDFRRYFASHYGPTMATYRAVGDDPGRVAALDEAIDDLAERFTDGGTMRWEYLLLICVRA